VLTSNRVSSGSGSGAVNKVVSNNTTPVNSTPAAPVIVAELWIVLGMNRDDEKTWSYSFLIGPSCRRA